MFGRQARVPLIDRLCDDQRRRWRRGERTPAEHYLGRYPTLDSEAGGAVELLYNEILLRREFGEPAGLEEYLGRFPHWAAPLRLLFEVDDALGSGSLLGPFTAGSFASEPGGMPDVAGYELMGELGRGGMGVVYRARHVRLGRIVALKMIRTGARRSRGSWPASAPRPRRRPGCSTPTSSRSTRSASTTGGRISPWSSLEGGSLAGRLAGSAAGRRRRRPRSVETLARAVHDAHDRGHRPPRPQAGQRPADRRRRPQDHRLRPGQAARRRRLGRADPDRRRSSARPATWPPSRPRGTPRPSGRPPTSTPWGRSSTSCSPAGRRSRGRPRSRPSSRSGPSEPGAAVALAARSVPRDLETICLKCLEKDPAPALRHRPGPGRRPRPVPRTASRSWPGRSRAGSGG